MIIKNWNLSLPAARQFGGLAIAAAILATSLPAMASLGGDAGSIKVDRAHMNASEVLTPSEGYDVHRLQTPDGSVVNEYATSSGTIFAVTWQGQFLPDMQQILGTYFQEYSAALAAQPKHNGHQPLNIQGSGLVVQTGGHMRAHWGRIYVPGLAPQGVQCDQLQ